MLVVLEALRLFALAQPLHLVGHSQEASDRVSRECATDDYVLRRQRGRFRRWGKRAAPALVYYSIHRWRLRKKVAHAVEIEEVRLLGVHAAAVLRGGGSLAMDVSLSLEEPGCRRSR